MPWKKRTGMPVTERKTIEIDATDKPVGRLATKIAMILMGKHTAAYAPHTDMGDRVVVTHVDKIVFTGKKWDQKVYYRTSNRPGGLKTTPVSTLRAEKPEDLLRHAVIYMLPKNNLQNLRMKRLTFTR
jgi:large subunit ribosomal protein L13